MKYVSFEKMKKDGKPYKHKCWRLCKAILVTPIRRYNCGMTVGHGWYENYSHTDPAGAPIKILGAFEDGRLSVELTHGGCSVLGKLDVHIVDCDELTREEKEFLRNIPCISHVTDQELNTTIEARKARAN